jgi:hypothetical protein
VSTEFTPRTSPNRGPLDLHSTGDHASKLALVTHMVRGRVGTSADSSRNNTPAARDCRARLSQVCDRWIYWACMYFGLTLKEQARGALATSTQSTKPSTSRSLLFRVGAQMEQGFDQVAGRTQPRLDVPAPRTLFGATPRAQGHPRDHDRKSL